MSRYSRQARASAVLLSTVLTLHAHRFISTPGVSPKANSRWVLLQPVIQIGICMLIDDCALHHPIFVINNKHWFSENLSRWKSMIMHSALLITESHPRNTFFVLHSSAMVSLYRRMSPSHSFSSTTPGCDHRSSEVSQAPRIDSHRPQPCSDKKDAVVGYQSLYSLV